MKKAEKTAAQRKLQALHIDALEILSSIASNINSPIETRLGAARILVQYQYAKVPDDYNVSVEHRGIPPTQVAFLTAAQKDPQLRAAIEALIIGAGAAQREQRALVGGPPTPVTSTGDF